LAAGEIAFSTDDQTFRIGDGVTAWSDLAYFQNSDQLAAAGLQVLTTANLYTNGVVEAASTSLTAAIGASQAASTAYTNAQIASLVDSAPETLNTLNEIASALQANDGDIDTITALLGTKSDIGHTHSLDELSDVVSSTAIDQDVLYYDSSTQTWKPKELVGIDQITVVTTAQDGVGSLAYDSESGQFTYTPPVTGVTAGSYATLKTTTTFAASTGGYYTYNDGSQNLEVTITTTVGYTSLISLTADHVSSGYAAAKLYRVVNGVETEIFDWAIIIGKDFSWTVIDEHNLPAGTTVTYRLKGKGATSTSYIGQNCDVQLYVQELAGALGGQPTSPDITVETATTGSATGALSYVDGVLIYTPVEAAAALSELTDVDLTDLSDTDVLAYDASSGKWLPGSAASSVAQLQDVDLTGISNGAFLRYSDTSATWSAQTIDIAPSLVSFNEQTSSYVIVDSDKDKMIEINSATAVTLTIPDDAQFLAMPNGSIITVMQTGLGQITISPGSGVTIRYTPSNITRTQWSSATLIKRGSNLWYLMGDLA
jgi:hypothetical protein